MKGINNNKGFTLIELLAVVVILLIISTIAISSISAAIERNKAKQLSKKIEVIEGYAQTYYMEHKNTMSVGSVIELSELELSDNELVDANGRKICGYVVVEANGLTRFIKDNDRCND